MSKFGDLIQSENPVLIDFYSLENNQEASIGTLKEIATAFKEQVKVIRIDVEKNDTLAKALRIKHHPTYIIYKENEMKWRQSGQLNSTTLIEMLEQFI